MQKMKSQKKGDEYLLTSQGMQCFKMCNSWCKSSNGHSNGESRGPKTQKLKKKEKINKIK
jgi:hypothetical protein